MTSWEVDHYAKMFGISPKRFIHIPFPMHQDKLYSQVTKDPILVMSSGRQSCDWEMLLKVATWLPQYRFLIVHYRKDKKKFKRLVIPPNCKLLSDIPQYVHDRLLERSTCYVITLLESFGSSGHVRLSHATHLEVPVIITDVAGIREYVIDKETALVVPPNDPFTLKNAIERLMSDPNLQKKISENAKKLSKKWTRYQYFQYLSKAIHM
jgi:glycosyltransferase involved in cell wall biosynthesis